ncbi:MAG: hypothetical protein AAFN70_05570 [Planctomycetota bacterium]
MGPTNAENPFASAQRERPVHQRTASAFDTSAHASNRNDLSLPDESRHSRQPQSARTQDQINRPQQPNTGTRFFSTVRTFTILCLVVVGLLAANHYGRRWLLGSMVQEMQQMDRDAKPGQLHRIADLGDLAIPFLVEQLAAREPPVASAANDRLRQYCARWNELRNQWETVATASENADDSHRKTAMNQGRVMLDAIEQLPNLNHQRSVWTTQICHAALALHFHVGGTTKDQTALRWQNQIQRFSRSASSDIAVHSLQSISRRPARLASPIASYPATNASSNPVASTGSIEPKLKKPSGQRSPISQGVSHAVQPAVFQGPPEVQLPPLASAGDLPGQWLKTASTNQNPDVPPAAPSDEPSRFLRAQFQQPQISDATAEPATPAFRDANPSDGEQLFTPRGTVVKESNLNRPFAVLETPDVMRCLTDPTSDDYPIAIAELRQRNLTRDDIAAAHLFANPNPMVQQQFIQRIDDSDRIKRRQWLMWMLAADSPTLRDAAANRIVAMNQPSMRALAAECIHRQNQGQSQGNAPSVAMENLRNWIAAPGA